MVGGELVCLKKSIGKDRVLGEFNVGLSFVCIVDWSKSGSRCLLWGNTLVTRGEGKVKATRRAPPVLGLNLRIKACKTV